MAKSEVLTKRVAINKANVQMVIAVGVASFVIVFCLVAGKAVLGLNGYQARVISAKEKAHQQLLKNIQTYNNLTTSYETFISTPNNVIGGVSSGTGPNDGNNAKIVLDALPPSYDFPALTSSIEKILTDHALKVATVTGTDNQLTEQGNAQSSNPQPVAMPFSFSVNNANYTSVSQLITALQQSIRPIQLDSMDITGGSSDMTLTINLHTYYQTEKSVSITQKAVK